MDGRTITSAGAASRWATRRPRNPTAAAATAGTSRSLTPICCAARYAPNPAPDTRPQARICGHRDCSTTASAMPAAITRPSSSSGG